MLQTACLDFYCLVFTAACHSVNTQLCWIRRCKSLAIQAAIQRDRYSEVTRSRTEYKNRRMCVFSKRLCLYETLQPRASLTTLPLYSSVLFEKLAVSQPVNIFHAFLFSGPEVSLPYIIMHTPTNTHLWRFSAIYICLLFLAPTYIRDL